MNEGSKKGFHGVLTKLLLSLLLLTIPVYLIALSVLGSAITNVKNRITSSVFSDLDRFTAGLETDLERVKLFQLMLKNDENVQFLSTAQGVISDYDKIALYKELQSKFDLIISNSSFIDDLAIDFLDFDLRLSYVTGRTAIPPKDLKIYAEEDFSDGWLKTSYGQAELDRRVSDVLSYTLYMKTVRAGKTKIHYVLRMNIALNKFHKLLQDFKIGQSGSALILDRAHGFLIDPSSGGELAGLVSQRIQEHPDPAGDFSDGQFNLTYNNQQFAVMYKTSEALNWTVAVFVPEKEIMGEVQGQRRMLYALIVVTIVSIIGFSYVIYRQIHKPIRVLFNAMRQVERDRYDTRIPSRRNDEFDYIYIRFNQMIQRIESLIQKDYLQQIRIKQSELNQLQAQINPHFLYNCFYIIYRMSKERDYDSIAEMTDYLGRYYQFLTYNSGSDEVLLEEEIGHSAAYLKIQQIRFESQLAFEIDVDSALGGIPVPRLILQPLVENVIVHALEKSARDMFVLIRAERVGDALELSVEDDGPGLHEERRRKLIKELEIEREHPETSFALWNIHWRIRYKYGLDYGIAIGHREHDGFLITIRLPAE
ncbi:sensor histidine kinase [Paenibacillus sp. GCM10027626]|uniref:sensor histidine kinase n=1 Tax=Paenibacillus sp. GCM10027626 TaxID=3273411 RepID=UPI0036309934